MIASPARRRWFAILGATTLMAGLFPIMAARAVSPPAPPVMSGPVVSPAVHQDVSLPLREIIENNQDQTGNHKDHHPKPIPPPHSRTSPSSGTPSSTTLAAAPAVGLQFDGVGNGFSGPAGTFTVSSAPPDTNLAVGPNHVVEIVNSDFAIFNKSGTAVFGPVAINTLWSGFGGGCQANNDGDPIAKYDSIADRWLISQFSVTTTPYLQCVAVSQTADPTGAYNRYSFQYNDFPDYPKLSVWPDAYYITFNMFAGGTTFSGGQACAYDRAKMLAGQAATQQCFNLGTTFGGLLASDLDGTQPPPAGSPNYIVAQGAASNQLAYWQFHTDWTAPANTTLTGPTTLATAPFAQACAGGTCIPESGTTQQLDSLADRLMYRLAYRNFGDHEALVVNHSITAGSSVGVRWYELRTGGGNALSIFQQGTYAPDSDYRWMGSIAQDRSGDIGLGFSISGSSRHPGIHYTGRLTNDPAGTMAQGEGAVIEGGGSQTATLSRWGDYSALAVDPVDGCTFWYGNEYIPANGTFNWKTRIATFKFPGCGGAPPPNDFSISASPSTVTVAQGGNGNSTVSTATTAGSAQTVTFSASGLPAGATASFNPGSLPSGGSSTLTLRTAASTAAGSYPITVTGTGTSATHSTTVSLTVNASGGSGGITNGGFETGTFAGWTTTATTSMSTTPHSGSFAGMAGGTSPTNGDSTIAQTFTAPSTTGPLTFWYQIHCPDTITYDWASATLRDNTANTNSVLLVNTCSNTGVWQQSSPASMTGGHSYTLTLLSHDDNYATDPTYVLFDDVTLAAPPTPDFTISASPGSQSVVQGSATNYTVSVAASNGFAGTVGLTASGLPNGAAASFNPTSITTGSGSSTLSISTSSSTPAGSYPLTITGSNGSTTHSTSVSLVVTAPPPPSDFSISASPASRTVTQGSGTTYTVTTAITSGSAQTVSFSASGLPAGASATFSPTSVTSGSSPSTLTLTTVASTPAGSYTFTVTGTGTSATHTASAGLVVNVPSATVIVNGGFETGSLSGWTATGSAAVSTTAHTGTYAAQVGSASPFNGDSTIAQTFTAPAGTGHALSFWYRVVCTDSVTYDWATATLKDNTSNTTSTVLARTCTNNGTYVQKSVALTGGHSYTLTLIDHDDNWVSPPDPTYALYDDVSVS